MSRADLAVTEAERLRVEHFDRLVALGADAVDELLAALSERSWTVRRAVIGALAALGDDAAAPLMAWLHANRSEEHAIAAAVDAAVASVGETTNRVVAALATDDDPAVVADVATILGRRRARDQVDVLERLLAHPDDNVAVAAIEALGAIGGNVATESLLRVVATKDFFRTFPAIQVLGKTGDPRAVAPLAALLDDEVFRIEAVRALGRSGAAQAIAPIGRLVTDDATVGLAAVALADLISHARWLGAEPTIAAQLRDDLTGLRARFIAALPGSAPTERTALFAVLAKIGDAETISALLPYVDDPQHAAAAEAAIRDIGADHPDAIARALGSSDAIVRAAVLPMVTARAAVPRIRALLGDEDVEVRARACEALARLGDTSVVPSLFPVLADASLRVSHAAAGAIQSLGATATPNLVIDGITTGSTNVRRQTLRIAAYLGLPQTFAAALAASRDPDVRTAELAVAAVGAIDDPRRDAELALLAASADATLRAAAMRAAGTRPSPATRALLERGLTDDAPWVRYYSCRGLGALAHEAPTELLMERLTDPVPHVRVAAIEALAHVDIGVAWDALAAMARSADPDERRAALVGISQRPTDAALALLLEASRGSDPATQLIALAGLARSTNPAALQRLAEAMRSDDQEVRTAALSLLAERDDRATAELLLDLATSEAPDHPVHYALSTPHPARIAALAARLVNASASEATMLVPALARMGTPAAVDALRATLAAPSPAARRTAAVALVAIGADGARATATRMASNDPDPDVRHACAAAIR